MIEKPITLTKSMILKALKDRIIELPLSLFKNPGYYSKFWVRESFRRWRGSVSRKTIIYSADDQWIDWGSKAKFIEAVTWLTPVTSPSKMPKWASRFKLEIIDIKNRTVVCLVLETNP